MKKTIFVLLAIFAFFLIALIAVPIIFKDQILERVDREIAGAVNAQVYYDYDNIGLSIFKSFPSISATIREFGVIGNPPFQNDTLAHIDALRIDINLFSVVFADTPELRGVHLDGGSIYIKVLEDGTANYDIAVESGETSSADTSEFRLGVNRIEIAGLDFIYDDRQLRTFAALGNLNMRGSGDFSSDIYDLDAVADVDIVRVDFEDINYLSNKALHLDTRINVNLEEMRFGLEEAEAALNDFLFEVDGYLAMPADDMEFDLTIEGRDNSFKSILSLVPGIYTESFDGLETSGSMDFNGFFKGIYNENSFPAFELALTVDEGMFRYPDLPTPISDVNVNMLVQNPTDNLDNTRVNISEFNLNFGNNPISGRLLLENLITYDINGQLLGKLNLEEITSIFPIEGMELRGSLNINATAEGRYDSVAKVIPHIDAVMVLNNGYVKSTEYPAPVENLNVNLSVINNTGNMNDLMVDLSSFGFDLEGESINGELKINDLERLNWDGSVDGSLDLGKLSAIMSLEDVIMEGQVQATVDTKGNYTDVEAGRYDRIEASGQLNVSDFYYTDTDLPQGIRINSANLNFAPNEIKLAEFDSRLGESPLVATGSLSNYMGFLFAEDQVLRGTLDLYSSRFNINEWLTESGEAEDTTELSVIELPRNVNFTLSVKADEVLYDNLTLDHVTGTIVLNDGILNFNNTSMNTLGGRMALNGSYDPRDISAPRFDMAFEMQSVKIQDAFQSFNTVRAFAPVAQHINGDFNSQFKMSGLLGQDMMPVLSSLNGHGVIKLLEAAYKDSQILQGITSLTKLKETNTINFRDLNLSGEINNGMFQIKPFDLRLWDYQAHIQGSTGFDGSINYLLNIQVPVNKLGSTVSNVLSGIANEDVSGGTIPVGINIQGRYANPKLSLAGGESIENYVTNALKARLSNATGKIQESLADEFKAREDSLKQEIRAKAEQAKDSVKVEAERVVNQTRDRTVDELKNLLKGFGNRPRSAPDTVP